MRKEMRRKTGNQGWGEAQALGDQGGAVSRKIMRQAVEIKAVAQRVERDAAEELIRLANGILAEVERVDGLELALMEAPGGQN
ncbi:MAG: hypothetical protein AB7E46_15040 [Desulfovibrio sp.]